MVKSLALRAWGPVGLLHMQKAAIKNKSPHAEFGTRTRCGFNTNKDGPAARGAAQEQTLVCLTPATASEDRSAVRANGAASARNPRRSHWAKPKPQSGDPDVAVTQIRGLLGG